MSVRVRCMPPLTVKAIVLRPWIFTTDPTDEVVQQADYLFARTAHRNVPSCGKQKTSLKN